MVATSSPLASPTKPAWSVLFDQPAKAFGLTDLTVLAGKVPQGLRGRLFRNGPGRLTRGQDRMGHWFDGDGAILGVYFTDEGVKAQYRYVDTPFLREEEAAGKLLHPNYGTLAAGKFWQRWGKPAKNVANTSVLPLGDRLLALWEAGKPYALNGETLETLGEDNLGLNPSDTFSAHYKIQPDTGEIYNFGVTFGKNAVFQLYKYDASGNIIQRNSFTIPDFSGLPLVHDFVLAGDYLIFCVCPVCLQVFPALLGLKTISDALQWRPELGTDIIIVDRHSLKPISFSKQEPWFQWHFTNGYVNQQGEIILEIARSDNFNSNQQFVEIPLGKIQTKAKATLWQYRINPHNAEILECFELGDLSCEFPSVLDSQTGKAWDTTFIGIHREESDIGQELINAIACFNQRDQTFTIADMGADHYPSEPIPVSNPENPDQIWVLTVVFNAPQHRSELRIYDGDRLHEDPLCILGFPEIIPPSFHGKWQAR